MTLTRDITKWFGKQLPKGWFTGEPEILVDDDEIMVVGTLPDPEAPADASDATLDAVRVAAIKQFREHTRDERIGVAQEAEKLFGRKVSWGARCGDAERVFTSLGVPVMTRLRLPERRLLDTLVDAGVARSRSDALAWCVRRVGEHQGEWLRDLDDALEAVRRLRETGPAA